MARKVKDPVFEFLGEATACGGRLSSKQFNLSGFVGACLAQTWESSVDLQRK
jgi:hypothetical protein